jgi:chromatin assembly factor 1 subunit A
MRNNILSRLQEKEKQEKKVAKIERQRKADEAQNKSRNLMANFFGKKAKPSEPIAASGSSSASPSKNNLEAMGGMSEYEKTFKPFVAKKNIEVAPTNWFRSRRRAKNKRKNIQPEDSVIIIDVEDGTEQSVRGSDIPEGLEQPFTNTRKYPLCPMFVSLTSRN